MMVNKTEIEKIAVIGMAGRFPKAANLDQFWQNLRSGSNAISIFSDTELKNGGIPEDVLSNPDYVKKGYVLEDIDLFDADFFSCNTREAEMMDPQQRMFLEASWDALENAGCSPDRYPGSIGVFAGSSPSDYLKGITAASRSLTSSIESFQAMVGNSIDFLSTRVSYKLNLKGPSYTLQTACSTSLVAVHVACQNLLAHQCDIALAGGIAVGLPQGLGYTYHDGMLWSPDGLCRSFDAKAQGTVFGQGMGIIVLKRLSEAIKDKDFIYAVIRGSAINNDGSAKAGFTAPSIDGQAEVITLTLEASNTDPATLDYIETHGSGTRLGDPIEIAALTKAFRRKTDKKGYCGVGSVKSNIGHLDTAAGIAGIMKTILALHHKEMPPSLNFDTPNPEINFPETPFYVVDTLRPWPSEGKPRRAAVSSFGIGGTNAHVILEEAPLPSPVPVPAYPELLVLSARTPQALKDRGAALAGYLKDHPDCCLSSAAYTLQCGRTHFKHRKALVCTDLGQAIAALAADEADAQPQLPGKGKPAVFMFSGQGSQYTGMGRELYEQNPFFRDQVDRCSTALNTPLGLDLRTVLFAPQADTPVAQLINQTWITQPALFVMEYSLARLFMDWGLVPGALLGHSIGEYVAACLSGVFSLPDALTLVAARGKLMQELEPGSMLSVPLPEAELLGILPQDLSIAVVNSPTMTVVSGKTAAIELFRASLLASHGVEGKLLQTSHAFHSSMMDPIVPEFTALVASLDRHPPDIPFVSNVSGTWISPQEAVSAEYWGQHLRQAVRFSTCLGTLAEAGYRRFIELGPGQVLAALARQNLAGTGSLIVPATRRPAETGSDTAFLLNSLGRLWCSGLEPEWSRVFPQRNTHKIPLPGYPFQRKRYWIEAKQPLADNRLEGPESAAGTSSSTEASIKGEAPQRQSVSSLCRPETDLELQISNIVCGLLGLAELDTGTSFFDMGADSITVAQLLAALNKGTNGQLTLTDIFEHPTIEALAKQVQLGGLRLRSPVLALNKAQTGQLVYFVVGIQLYHNLALHLEDTARCYGTFLPAEEALLVSGVGQNNWKVVDLALAYCDEILKHSKGNPLSLVGVSFGGVVAYEMARQLAAKGVQVSLLVMLDSLLPSGMRRNKFKWLGNQLGRLKEFGLAYTLRRIRGKLLPGIQVRQPEVVPANHPGEVVPDQRLVVYADAVARFEKSDASSTYGGKTLLIHAKDDNRFPNHTIQRHFGWNKHLTGEFLIDTAPGDHLGILKPPHVAVTASIIRQALTKKGENP